MNTVGKTARGLTTVVRRRGIGYLGYLVAGCVWPQLMYRFFWGPTAPHAGRLAFSSVGRLSVRPATEAQLFDAGLIDRSASAERSGPVDPADVEVLMDRAHAAGITGVHNAFDRARYDRSGALKFTAMPDARQHGRRGAHFLAARDDDRRAFNARFGASLLTEGAARQQLKVRKSAVPSGYRDYAPIDFGGGLSIGQIASTDSGTGRWDFFNRRIVAPLIAGKRVLDLGSNNGSLPLMMLRSGAREVVAVEFTPAIADFARLNADILAWRDLRRYNIDVLTGDMRMFLERDLGQFDVVTAFCSLYYLPEADMLRIMEKAASMDATLVLQANEAIDDLPAHTSQLQRLMRDAGYARVEVFAPAGFARPLLVGHPTILEVGHPMILEQRAGA